MCTSFVVYLLSPKSLKQTRRFPVPSTYAQNLKENKHKPYGTSYKLQEKSGDREQNNLCYFIYMSKYLAATQLLW